MWNGIGQNVSRSFFLPFFFSSLGFVIPRFGRWDEIRHEKKKINSENGREYHTFVEPTWLEECIIFIVISPFRLRSVNSFLFILFTFSRIFVPHQFRILAEKKKKNWCHTWMHGMVVLSDFRCLFRLNGSKYQSLWEKEKFSTRFFLSS